jgi:hypothetical protein
METTMNDENFLNDIRAIMHDRTERHVDKAALTPPGSADQDTVVELLKDSLAIDPALPPPPLHSQGN